MVVELLGEGVLGVGGGDGGVVIGRFLVYVPGEGEEVCWGEEVCGEAVGLGVACC